MPAAVMHDVGAGNTRLRVLGDDMEFTGPGERSGYPPVQAVTALPLEVVTDDADVVHPAVAGLPRPERFGHVPRGMPVVDDVVLHRQVVDADGLVVVVGACHREGDGRIPCEIR